MVIEVKPTGVVIIILHHLANSNIERNIASDNDHVINPIYGQLEEMGCVLKVQKGSQSSKY